MASAQELKKEFIDGYVTHMRNLNANPESIDNPEILKNFTDAAERLWAEIIRLCPNTTAFTSIAELLLAADVAMREKIQGMTPHQVYEATLTKIGLTIARDEIFFPEHASEDPVVIVGDKPIERIRVLDRNHVRITTASLLQQPDKGENLMRGLETAMGMRIYLTTWGEYRKAVTKWNETHGPKEQVPVY